LLARPKLGVATEFSVWINLPWLVVLACLVTVAHRIHLADLVPAAPPLLEAMVYTAALGLATNMVRIFLCTRLCHLTDHLLVAGRPRVLVQLGLSVGEGLEGSLHLLLGKSGHAVPCWRWWRWCRRWRGWLLHLLGLAEVRSRVVVAVMIIELDVVFAVVRRAPKVHEAVGLVVSIGLTIG